MITHVVLFQTKEPKAANNTTIVEALRGMEGRVDGLSSITVGIDINGGPRASDICLITTHEDAAALSKYQADALPSVSASPSRSRPLEITPPRDHSEPPV